MVQTAARGSAEVTQLLVAWGQGDRRAVDRLMPLVYKELRKLAAGYLRSERPGHTLQPTALVHEVFLRLVDQNSVAWRSRGQFFAVAARAMRQVLVDHARGRRAKKRGGNVLRVVLTEAMAPPAPSLLSPGVGEEDALCHLIALDGALTQLEDNDAELARIVELRFFAGLSIEETAQAMGISPATVKRGWATARAWLYCRLSTSSPDHS